jgi:aldehyde dehydrogenase (NAD+)
MQEEIFGPILPVVTFESLKEAEEFVTSRPHPLALYFFGPEREARRFMARAISGGACINDTIMHIANENTPFGGVGNSGMGRYHGHESFLAFSHTRSLLTSPRKLDLPLRYMPYRLWGLIKRFL